MKRKIHQCLVVLGFIGVCIGLSGCGKNTDTAVDTAADTKAESTVPLEIGEHVIYGSYQGEAIEWRILDKKGGDVLLLSEYGLDAQPFDDSGKGRVLWEDSSIRKWLNNDFYNSAFSEEERENIVLSFSEGFDENNESIYVGSEEPYWHLERETEDRVFLPSYTELCEYFNPDPEGGYDLQYGHDELLCYPTEYAEQHLERVLQPDTCGWWLCNPEYNVGDGFSVGVEVITAYGQLTIEPMNSRQNAVRPAMWVTWQSDMEAIEEK